MDKKFLKTYFFCVIGTLLLAVLLWNSEDVTDAVGFVLHAFRPVIVGAVFAFLLNRPFEGLRKLYRWSFPRLKPKTRDILSVATLYLLLLGLAAAILGVILPQLYTSINLFLSNLEGYYQNITRLTETALSFGGHNWWEELQIEQKLQELIGSLPDLLQKAVSGITGMIADVIGTITDCAVGLVISVYGLSQKETLLKQAKRVLKAFAGARYYSRITELFSLFFRTFSNFFSGQLTEVMILGVLCFIGMKLFRFEYALLISVIIALSNLIPIVGPIIGTIPCALILFLIEPSQAVWFIVFIIVLQQLEANLIYPKVVGGSVGLPAVWVLISVVVGGSLFGLMGMLFAIPTVSVAYQLIKQYVTGKTKPEPPSDGEKELEVYRGGETDAPPHSK